MIGTLGLAWKKRLRAGHRMQESIQPPTCQKRLTPLDQFTMLDSTGLATQGHPHLTGMRVKTELGARYRRAVREAGPSNSPSNLPSCGPRALSETTLPTWSTKMVVGTALML